MHKPNSRSEVKPKTTRTAAQRRQRRIVGVSLLGACAFLGAVAVYLFVQSDSMVTEHARALPGELQHVGGIEFGQLLRHPWIQKVVENPVSQSLLQVSRSRGLDIMSVESAVGGVGWLDQHLHVLILIKGPLALDRLREVVCVPEAAPIQLHGESFYPIEFAGALWGADSEESEVDDQESPSLYLGQIEDDVLVVGTQRLIDSALSGASPTVGEDPVLGPLIGSLDSTELVWLAGQLEGELVRDAGSILGIGDALENAAFRISLGLNDRLRVQLRVDFPDTELGRKAAQTVEAVLQDGTLVNRLLAAQALASVVSDGELPELISDSLEGDWTLDGTRFEASIRWTLPDLTGL